MRGVTVAVVFAPDPILGPDPKDTTAMIPRRLGEIVPPDADLVLVWREWGEQFDGGSRTHVVTGGAWAHITSDQIRDTLATIGDVE